MKKLIFLAFILPILLFMPYSYAKGYGVGRNKKGERPNINDKIITDNNGYCIGQDTKDIYLTFDCGYENGYTAAILDTLAKTNTKAIFFITGHYLQTSQDLVQRMLDEGHLIGNHTYSHKDFTKSTASEILTDVKKLEDSFFTKMGVKMSKYVRPPRGEYNEMSQKLLKDNGYKSIFWSLAFVDWNKDVCHGNHYSYDKVMNKIHNGAIILMHTVGKDNMLDLEDIIVDLKQEGYVFKTVDNLWYNSHKGLVVLWHKIIL